MYTILNQGRDLDLNDRLTMAEGANLRKFQMYLNRESIRKGSIQTKDKKSVIKFQQTVQKTEKIELAVQEKDFLKEAIRWFRETTEFINQLERQGFEIRGLELEMILEIQRYDYLAFHLPYVGPYNYRAYAHIVEGLASRLEA